MKENTKQTAAQVDNTEIDYVTELERKRIEYYNEMAAKLKCNKRRILIIDITPLALFSMLKLPKDIDYVGAMFDFNSDSFQIKIRNDEFPIHKEGESIQHADLILNEDGSCSVELPKSEDDIEPKLIDDPFSGVLRHG